MVESDHNAVFSDGKKQTVYIYQTDGRTKYVVEREYHFFEAKLLPGFLRLEKQPDLQPPVVESPPVESTKLMGSSWGELKRSAEERERQARAKRYTEQESQQEIPASRDSAFAKASHAQAQAVASQRGQSGPNSKLQR
jgi:hypothetical protein